MIVKSKVIALSLLTSITMLVGKSGYAQHVKFSPLERQLIEWTDAREHVDSLVGYLSHKDEKIAWRAAVGLANIQDSNTRAPIIKALRNEKRDAVQDAMSFALGCMGPNEAAGQTVLFVTQQMPSTTKLEALGRTITETQLQSTLGYLVNDLKSRAGLDALVQIALRNMPVSKALKEAALESKFEDMLDRFADNEHADARWKTAYFFSRLNDSIFNLEHLETIQTLLNDQGEPLSRMFAATALARIHSLQTQNILSRALRSERDWQVRTNILGALTRAISVDSITLATVQNAILSADASDEGSLHVATSAWGTLEDWVTKGKIASADSLPLRDWLRMFAPYRELYPTMPVDVRVRALPILARFGGGEEIQTFVTDINMLRSRLATESAVKAISIFDDTTGFRGLLMSVSMVQPRQQLMYIEGLHELWTRSRSMPWFAQWLETSRLANAYRHMLIRLPSISDDPASVATVLEHVQDSTIISDKEFREEARQYFTSYLSRFDAPQYSDQLMSTVQAIKWLGDRSDSTIRALGLAMASAVNRGERALADSVGSTLTRLGNYSVRPSSPSGQSRPSIDWKLLETASDTILMSTDKGLMYIALDKYNAPLTSLNFIKLARMNYFANNVFHRVVPNFVIQAGDPTQTGYGGPGYAIRREVSPNIRFDAAGKIGMASSGKDTEGSQWFITHLPTPHLDSRYTVFGEVVSGAEAINKIQLYDKISNIFQMTK